MNYNETKRRLNGNAFSIEEIAMCESGSRHGSYTEFGRNAYETNQIRNEFALIYNYKNKYILGVV